MAAGETGVEQGAPAAAGGEAYARAAGVGEALAALGGGEARALLVADAAGALAAAAERGLYALALGAQGAMIAGRMADLGAGAARLLSLRGARFAGKLARFERGDERLDGDRFAAVGLASDLAQGVGVPVQRYAAPELGAAATDPEGARARLSAVLADAQAALLGSEAAALSVAGEAAVAALPGGWRKGSRFDIFLAARPGAEAALIDLARRLDAALGNSGDDGR